MNEPRLAVRDSLATARGISLAFGADPGNDEFDAIADRPEQAATVREEHEIRKTLDESIRAARGNRRMDGGSADEDPSAYESFLE